MAGKGKSGRLLQPMREDVGNAEKNHEDFLKIFLSHSTRVRVRGKINWGFRKGRKSFSNQYILQPLYPVHPQYLPTTQGRTEGNPIPVPGPICKEKPAHIKLWLRNRTHKKSINRINYSDHRKTDERKLWKNHRKKREKNKCVGEWE